MLNMVIREGHPEKVIFEKDEKEMQSLPCRYLGGKNTGRANSQCKGPEVGSPSGI